MICLCGASVEGPVKEGYRRIYVCNLAQDKGLVHGRAVLPHPRPNTIYTESDVMALKNVVNDSHDLPLLYIHEYVLKHYRLVLYA